MNQHQKKDKYLNIGLIKAHREQRQYSDTDYKTTAICFSIISPRLHYY